MCSSVYTSTLLHQFIPPSPPRVSLGFWNISFLFTLTSWYSCWIQHIQTGLPPRLSQAQGMVCSNFSTIDFLTCFDKFWWKMVKHLKKEMPLSNLHNVTMWTSSRGYRDNSFNIWSLSSLTFSPPIPLIDHHCNWAIWAYNHTLHLITSTPRG